MPFVSPLLFGSSTSFDAIIEFGDLSDAAGGTADPLYKPDSATIVSDPSGIFGSVVTVTNGRYISIATFGDYEFTVLQNYTSANISTALVEISELNGSIGFEQTIMSLTSGSTILTPSPATVTFTDTANRIDGVTVEMAASFAQRQYVGTLRLGVKAV